MKERFEGEAGRLLLIDALKEQRLVEGDEKLAEAIAEQGLLIEAEVGVAIIEQGGEETDVFFIVAGACDVVVNGRWMAERKPGTYVGEMAAIEPSQRRSATVTAKTKSVFVKINAEQFFAFGKEYKDVWKRVAKELARRLEQRNRHVTTTHEKIRVFIISSVEALAIAREIQNAFEHDDFHVVIWTDGVFQASNYAIESLEAQVDQSDFAIAIAQPDDVTTTRKKRGRTPRDNVIFELGFFMGRLGRKRTLLLEPRGDAMKLPTDLSGITPIPYKVPTDTNDLASSLGPTCTKIRAIIRDLGPNN